MARIGIMIIFIAGVVASRAQCRFGILAVGLHMAIKLNQVKYWRSLYIGYQGGSKNMN